MYELMIDNKKMTFNTYYEREDYIIDHWKEIEECDVLVPCSLGGWIDIRDAY